MLYCGDLTLGDNGAVGASNNAGLARGHEFEGGLVEGMNAREVGGAVGGSDGLSGGESHQVDHTAAGV